MDKDLWNELFEVVEQVEAAEPTARSLDPIAELMSRSTVRIGYRRKEKHNAKSAFMVMTKKQLHWLQRIVPLDLKLSKERSNFLIFCLLKHVKKILHCRQLQVKVVGAVLRKMPNAKVAVNGDRSLDRLETPHDQIQ